jgi:hypothetical protein
MGWIARQVNVFVMQLVDAGHHALVPLYAVHLRSTLREPLYTAFLGKLTVEPPERKVEILDQVRAERSIASGPLRCERNGRTITKLCRHAVCVKERSRDAHHRVDIFGLPVSEKRGGWTYEYE